MPDKSLIFLPDISGFTRFVNQTEISHSQHIIAELLEVLIDTNTLDMELVEIEGDALFYFQAPPLPSQDEFLDLVTRMFVRFHEHLQQYEHRRVCQCGACSTAIDLKLKFFAHAGPLEFIRVKSNTKPYGKEVIWAHRLMKNDVPVDEYLLISDPVNATLDAPKQDPVKVFQMPKPGMKSDKDMGELPYHYFILDDLKEQLGQVPPLPTGYLSPQPIIIELTINRPVEEVFDLVSNLELRTLWNKQVDKLDFEPELMNRLGSQHTCVVNGKPIDFQTVTQDFGPGKWVYGEKTHTIPLLRSLSNYFILSPQNNATLLRLEIHPEHWPVVGSILKPIVRSRLLSNAQNLTHNIKSMAEINPQ